MMINNLTMEFNTIKLREITIAILAGIALGIFILIYTGLTPRWIASYTVALIILFIAMSVKNPRNFFLALFAFSLPINAVNYLGKLSSTHIGGPPDFYYTFLDFPLLMLYILWIPEIFISKTAKIRFSKLDFFMLGIIMMSFLSIYNAVDQKLCIYSIVQLIKMYLIFFYFANAIKTKKELKYIIVFFLAGFFLENVLGIFEYFWGVPFDIGLLGARVEMMSFYAFSRVSGTLGHPNDFARYLLFFMPLSISLVFAGLNRIQRIMCILIFLMALSTLIFTQSRVAWVSLIISLIFLLFLFLKAKRISLRSASLTFTLGIILLLFIVFAFKGLIFTRLFFDDYGSASSRIPSIKVALNVIKEHPFLGVGINNYTEVMHLYDNTPEQITSKLRYGVHNSYFLIASEIGIIGVCFLIGFIILIFKQGIKAIFSNDKFFAYVTLGIIAGILGFLTSISVDPIYMTKSNFVCFWVTSGLIVTLAKMSKKHF